MKNLNLVFVIIFLFVNDIFGQNNEIQADAAALLYSKAILKTTLKKHLSILASDSLEGRQTGEQGQKKAATYIATQLQKMKLKPITFQEQQTYFQHYRIETGTVDDINTENVIAWIEGTDKKDEYLVLSAHYDHLGKENGKVYNGANDNASGTSALLEIAKAFAMAAKNGHQTRRSIVFIFFSGEEMGLLGSKAYVQNPIFPLDKTFANLNMDMIGRQEYPKDDIGKVYLIGAEYNKNLKKLSQNVSKTYQNMQLEYEDKESYYLRSDHYNFAEKGIPILFYHDGSTSDYHQTSDDVEKIIFPKVEKIARFIFFTAWELAKREQPLKK